MEKQLLQTYKSYMKGLPIKDKLEELITLNNDYISKEKVRKTILSLEEEFFLIIGENDNNKAINIRNVLLEELQV